MKSLIIIVSLLFLPVLALAGEGPGRDIVLESKAAAPRYFTLERQPGGKDVLKEESNAYSLAHVQFFDYVIAALDAVYDKYAKDLADRKVGSIIVAYESPDNLAFSFLSDEGRLTRELDFKRLQHDLPVRSALIIFDFFEADGKIDTNIVSFLQLADGLSLEEDVVLEYDIEKGSWIIKASGYVTRTRFFVTTKTKVQLSTEVAKEHLVDKIAKEYRKELEKIGAEEIVIEQEQV